MADFNKKILENGMRIITAPNPDSLATTILVLVEAGVKYETKDINGISHFLEHLIFKGTQKRPRSIDITSELDAIGATYNAFTSHEYTGYFAKARPDYFDKILDVISDIYLNPIFNPQEIDKERGVIIEEINMYEDLPQRRVSEIFTKLLYGDQPAGWDITGEKKIVKKLSQEDFLKYRSQHYLASSTLVVVTGKFDEEKTIKKIEKTFFQIKQSAKSGKIKTIEKQDQPAVLLQTKKTDQTHLVLGVRAFDIFDSRKYALQILTDILGGGMSSRVFQKVREEMSAAYYVYAGTDLSTDHGYLAVNAGVDHKKIEPVIEAILGEFKKLRSQPVGASELQRAKDHLIGHLFLSLETSDEIAGFYGGQEILTRKNLSPEQVAKKIQKVTPEEIQTVAQEIFQNQKLNLALIGPFEDQKIFDKILKL